MPEDWPLLRIFLDSNVLFSASLKPQNRFLDFWRLSRVELITSPYSLHEVERNIDTVEQDLRHRQLVARMTTAVDAPLHTLSPDLVLMQKDRQILASAIGADANYLVTGDANHFGHLFLTTVGGVTVMSPPSFLDLFGDRIQPTPLA